DAASGPAPETLIVTTEADIEVLDGLCSLREAILTANATSIPVDYADDCGDPNVDGADTITFADGISTITLQSDLPPLTGDTTIDGGNDVTIDGTGRFDILWLIGASTYALKGIEIVGESVSGINLEALSDQLSLTVENVTIDGPSYGLLV